MDFDMIETEMQDGTIIKVVASAARAVMPCST